MASIRPIRRMLRACILACVVESAVRAAGGAYSAHAQIAVPMGPMSVQNVTVATISFSEAYNSEQSQGNYWNALLLLNSGTEHQIAPLILKTTSMVRLGATYLDIPSTTNAVRVTENDLFVEGAVIYPAGWMMNPYISASIRTPITETFNLMGNHRVRMAKFWDPVTSMQGLGFAYILGGPFGRINMRVGGAMQQIRSHDHTMLTDDRSTPAINEAYKAQTGLEHVDDVYLVIDTAITYTGRLALFSAFEDLDVWTVRFDSSLQFRFLRFLAFTWNLGITNDIRVSPRTIFRHTVNFGIIQNF